MKRCQFNRCHEPAKWQARVVNNVTQNRTRIYSCQSHKHEISWSHEFQDPRGPGIPWGSYVPDPPEI